MKSLSDWLGLRALGLTMLGFTFALLGAEPLAFAFFTAAAATGAAASGLSLADRIESGDTDRLGYFIDIAGLVVSVIGVGQGRAGFQKALAAATNQGGEVLVTAGKRTLVEWTEQTLTKGGAVLIAVDSVLELNKINNDQWMTEEEKADRIWGLLQQIAMQGGILAIPSGRKLPEALKQRASKLMPLEAKVLSGLNAPAQAALEAIPGDDLRRVAQLAADHPAQVNDILAAGRVKSAAELEAELGTVTRVPVAAPTDAIPKVADSLPPTVAVDPPAPKIDEPTPTTDVTTPAVKAPDPADPGGRGARVLDDAWSSAPNPKRGTPGRRQPKVSAGQSAKPSQERGYQEGWPPPSPGPRPVKGASPEAMAEWRYRRYVHKQWKKGVAPEDVLTEPGYRAGGHSKAADTGGRPGRGGGKAQMGAKVQLAEDEGWDINENTQLGSREKGGKSVGNFVDGNRTNPDGGTDYLEVDHLNKGGKPSAEYQRKLAAEIKHLGPADSLTIVDSKNTARRITYTADDIPNAETVVSSRRVPGEK